MPERSRTRALITNDDGIGSPGLVALAAAAREAGLDVVVAAPDREYSGAAASITAVQEDGRTLVERVTLDELPDVEAYAVRAAPAHIVVLALHGWLDPVPDLVLSGINRGANVGRAVLHSGTVGAALTAGLLEHRGLAVSLNVPLNPSRDPHWDTAAAHVPGVLGLLMDSPESTTLSLNVPDLPADEVLGLREASLAQRGIVQSLVDEIGDAGVKLREVETGDDEDDADCDRALLARGHATLTALQSLREDRALGLAERLRSATPVAR
ncbi:5'/3'-nucleotidase SurE [Pseudonocardia humida]|uniref:5'-nucleotidase n=1 Tax=Pseudonocardia humida TaxID=2800819 RepID=A0ABT1ABG9_9PSEU|nr:5'/3'-nucleotidase SurE [Pseudonocardia humida]MCO1660407.1 5'/3'-nucleotidase SurE [Pseudonocardia humida]